MQSRRGQGNAPLKGEEFQYVVDFTGPALDALPAGSTVEAVATAVANAQLLEQNAYRVAASGHWRMTIRGLRRDPAQAVELRAFLRSNDNTLSETWTYLIPPN